MGRRSDRPRHGDVSRGPPICGDSRSLIDVARTLVSAAPTLMSASCLVGHASACPGEQNSPLDFGYSCGKQSCLHAAFQAAVSIRDEFLGLRRFHAGGHEAGEMRSCRSNCARLDKLKHVLQSGADMSVGTADTSVRATCGAMAHLRKWPKPRGEQNSPALQLHFIHSHSRQRQS